MVPEEEQIASGVSSGCTARANRSCTAAAPAASIDDRLNRLLAGGIATLEAQLASGIDPDPDRTARRLAQLVRMRVALRRGGAGPDDDVDSDPAEEPPARSLQDLRDQLRQHLEALRQERRHRGRGRAARPDAAGM